MLLWKDVIAMLQLAHIKASKDNKSYALIISVLFSH